jgi:hypothetical protein
MLGFAKPYAREVTNIKVTRRHIDHGTAKNASSCAIALALKEHFQDAMVVNVQQGCFILSDGCRSYLAEPPFVARWFIRRFDRHKFVFPIKFTLRFRRA